MVSTGWSGSPERAITDPRTDPFHPTGAARTLLLVPSMTLDGDGLAKIPGVEHYEERFLAFLHLLRDPATRLILITSTTPPPDLVHDTLTAFGCLPARDRLTLLDCADPSPRPLTEKVLRRPDLVAALRGRRPDTLIAFTGTALERELATRTGAALFATDPHLAPLGSKTGSRRTFAAAGVPTAPGHDGLRDLPDVLDALTALRTDDPTTEKALIKLNDSFGAGGNVLFPYAGAPITGLRAWVERELPTRAAFASPPDTWDAYAPKITQMGAVVERYLTGDATTSPSAQVLIDPTGTRVLSTHDQVLSGQVFTGATAPADPAYRTTLLDHAHRVARRLHTAGALGIASVDFIATRHGTRWDLHALEVNLRMGGGTAPHFLAHGLLRGTHTDDGALLAADGTPRAYYATDRVLRPEYADLTPADVLTALRPERFDGTTGTTPYMLGALSIGRFGLLTIGHDVRDATHRFHRAVDAVDARTHPVPSG
ncbi:hypothetical protein [Actinokineospora bangkokensis]|uniref:ATP-grasp domain-containing protein n=1 Tax=Actinokineospora bangkokensis TaxID=1193682 RepID=A0A1Q9LNN8_9PSEU|nr:hypothetical protein [Actinokineospora bangkokensis]OLR93652.1 hypothetical protein BJP25_15390 [Actinokineospora bangkokensis]